MDNIIVQSSSHSYQIVVAENIRFQIKKYVTKDYSSIMVVTDDQVAKLYLDDILSNFADDQVYSVIIPSGEQSKSFETYYQLQTEALKHKLDRKSLIIALGGGVVGDLAGFVAATFLRGIDYIQAPTTILAHDSSVGGKVAINHELGKNLIGSFYPPVAVIYDVETLNSLSPSEIRSGYAELVKEALISNAYFFEEILATNLADLSNQVLIDHLKKGIRVKAEIVESDEKEAGIRKFLNLGHTLAHALEAELGYGVITHGEAVAIGTLFAMRVSEETFDVTLPYEEFKQWLIENEYPLQLPSLDIDKLIHIMKLDKKVVNHKIQMVLMKAIGQLVVVEIDDEKLHYFLKKFISELMDK